jgi:Leucine-rich repeat (LRR) protein
LTQLLLGSNKLREFPVDLRNMTNLQSLSLTNNSFTGEVSNVLNGASGSTSFTVIDISRNNLTGELPTTFDTMRLSKLVVLLLGHNKIDGQIPLWIRNLTAVQVLDLSNNHFSGSISGDFSNLKGFIDSNRTNSSGLTSTALYNQEIVINVKDQQLTFTTILSLDTSMDFSVNELYGDIPTSIGELVGMAYFNLSSNAFAGTIPTAIGSLLNLQSLDLSNNRLGGTIPQSFATLSQLQTLRLANNNLTGRIPSSTQLQTQRNTSFLPGNPGLCGAPLTKVCETSRNVTTPASSSEKETFTDIFSVPGVFLGAVIGFFTVSFVFITWDPARSFLNLNKFLARPTSAISTNRVGLYRMP